MKISLVDLAAKRKPADLLFIGFFEKGKLSKEIETLEPAFSGIAKAAIACGRVDGKFSKTFSSYHVDYREAPEIVVIGLGEAKNYRKTCLKKTIGQIVRMAQDRKAGTVRLVLDSFTGGEVKAQDAVKVATYTTKLAAYEFDKYKTKKEDKEKPRSFETLELLSAQKGGADKLEEALLMASPVAEGTLFARDLVNEPGNVINPQTLVKAAQDYATAKKLTCSILDQNELKRLKMGGILAVNQGSVTSAAMIILEHGIRYKSKGTICLVGKGVTFDTGGISIKPAKDMEKMKYDMAGAAAVIAAMGVVADLKLERHVVALAPVVENMVAANPQRPGDIIRMYNGKTVEVINTDAEGRLILADALSYAEKYQPKAIIDLATLTGMCAYTFGDKAIGLLGNDARLLARVQKAGDETGERCWELPLWDEYREQIKGHHSDLNNTGGPYGGTITSAMFLKEFVPAKTPWAHLDIAGTAWCDAARYDCPKGATGVGVRLLAKLLRDWK